MRSARRPSSPARAGLAGLLLGALAAACGGGGADSGPRWIPLARGFRPATRPAAGDAAPGAIRARPNDGGRYRLEAPIPRAAWAVDRIAAQWVCDVPLGGGLERYEEDLLSLEDPAGETTLVQVASPRREEAESLAAGSFYLTPGRIHLRLAEAEAPPEVLLLVATIDRGAEVAGTWRTWAGEVSGEGLPVWAGSAERVRLDLPPASALRVTTLWRPFAAGDSDPARFRVTLDGVALLDVAEPAGGRGTAHVVALPAAGVDGAELAFTVEGAPGLAAFMTPVVGPASPGGYGQRPWGRGRPDVVLFLADTFRADNLGSYGGEHGAAPNLDRLAARSARFLNARSQAAWTLPAQVSLLAGVQPPQHGAVAKERAFPSGLASLPEVLAAAGYRTGAVTDSGFISRRFGFDQGFEWFEETEITDWDLALTLRSARDFLARDDGRPVFLFVHTYRTHAPYRTGNEDRAAWRELVRRAAADLKESGASIREVPAEHAAAFRELYLDGVRALDDALGPWLGELDAMGLGESGHLLFTSDHGEAFWEHGDFLHGGTLWDEKVRIPLLLRGPGIEARDVLAGAGLVDVPPTVAQLVGLPREPAWAGRSLVAPDGGDLEDAAVLVYGDEVPGLGARLAIVSGERKVFAPNDPAALGRGEFRSAYDLTRDPGEGRDLAGGQAEWAAEVCRSLAERIEEWNRPLTEPETARLTEGLRRDMAAIGYGEAPPR